KYYIKTFGCQMNKSDSERLKSVLHDLGAQECHKAREADIIILNTCSVRKTAEDRAFGLMSNYAKLKKENPHLILGITGCMVGHDDKEIIRKQLPMVDLYFSIKDLKNLPTSIQKIRINHKTSYVQIGSKKHSRDEYLEIIPAYKSTFEAFVPIMNGCNNFCSYCIVPYARGREISRPGREILEEIETLQKKGYQQVTLLGQNVNSYNPKDDFKSPDNPYTHPFASLLWEINTIGIPWVFFTAPHPKDMTDEVIDALTLPCMVNYLHLPLQS
ncbi:MAG: radical SAM protein, partial [bacterium]|nr:radical SAM protein [bacterium]